MRGDVETEILDSTEAQFLANIWQWYLLNDQKYRFVQTFNHHPQDFQFEKILEELDNIPKSFSPSTE